MWRCLSWPPMNLALEASVDGMIEMLFDFFWHFFIRLGIPPTLKLTFENSTLLLLRWHCQESTCSPASCLLAIILGLTLANELSILSLGLLTSLLYLSTSILMWNWLHSDGESDDLLAPPNLQSMDNVAHHGRRKPWDCRVIITGCCIPARHLDLSWNQLGPTGAFSLAAQLPKMHLRQLELSSNQLEVDIAALTTSDSTIVCCGRRVRVCWWLVWLSFTAVYNSLSTILELELNIYRPLYKFMQIYTYHDQWYLSSIASQGWKAFLCWDSTRLQEPRPLQWH